MHPRRLRVPVAGLASVSSLALIAAGTAQAAPTTTVVAKGLHTPKYLTIGPHRRAVRRPSPGPGASRAWAAPE